ncbi:MAG: hypothetical protein IKJ30_05970 [Bacilli bacterium]|nr:hypothetical protein [Bacilli bacterium]
MMPLTGGEKYIVKTLVIEINEMYPKISAITNNAKFEGNSKDLAKLYDLTLEIFLKLSKMTINMIDTNPVVKDTFYKLQEIHKYASVNKNNSALIAEVSKNVPNLVDALIKMVDDDTNMRDGVLRQIMEELGIVDPNAKKKRGSSFWDN